MASLKTATLLERLQEKVNIDVDTLDTDFISSLPIIPDDQTSNPAWLFLRLQHPSTKELATEIIKSHTDLQQTGDTSLLLSKLAVALCKRNIPLIKGRVLVQTSPAAAYNTQAIIKHARIYAEEFESAGIPQDRYCIKIMATGPGVNAAKVLANEGIPTLGTGAFSVAQAVACFQAKCLFISPYYNGISELQKLRELEDPSVVPVLQDVALQHSFSNRLVQMVQAYKQLYEKTGQQPPLIKNAGFASYREVIASAEIGCHSVTVSAGTIEEMLKPELNEVTLPDSLPTKLDNLRKPYAATVGIPPQRLQGLLSFDPLQNATKDSLSSRRSTLCDIEKDYLADSGKVLDDVIAEDSAAKRRLEEALELFMIAEQGSLEIIKGFFDAVRSGGDNSAMKL